MTDEELREMVRESIARHLGGGTVRGSSFGSQSRAHASHALLPLTRGGDEGDGRCLIEPSVRCNHCGYCLSYGH